MGGGYTLGAMTICPANMCARTCGSLARLGRRLNVLLIMVAPRAPLPSAPCRTSRWLRGCFTVFPPGVICPVVHRELGCRVGPDGRRAGRRGAGPRRVTFPCPGGDAFCPRLIDRHLAAMQAAGAEVVASDTGIRARCVRGVRAFTVDVTTPYGPSLGATVTAMLQPLMTVPFTTADTTRLRDTFDQVVVQAAWTCPEVGIAGSYLMGRCQWRPPARCAKEDVATIRGGPHAICVAIHAF